MPSVTRMGVPFRKDVYKRQVEPVSRGEEKKAPRGKIVEVLGYPDDPLSRIHIYLKQIKELFNPPPPKLPIIKDTTFAL